MKNFLIILFTLVSFMGFSQVSSSYVFSETTGTYTEIVGGTQLATTTGGAITYDTDGNYFTIPSGSQFQFNNTTITSVNMTADGTLFLNPGTTTTGNGITGPISSTGTAAGVIAGLGMDLRSTAIASQVYERRWQDVGTEVVFQWKNAARYLQSSSERFSFQIRINKSNGQIRIVYGNMTSITTSTTYQPMVGLRGTANTDYNNRRLTNSVPDATPNWGAPNGTTAGTSNSHNVRFMSTCVPVNGLTFIWTVQSCTGPSSPTITYTSSTGANLSWTASSSNPSSGYQWELRTSGAGGSGATGLVTSGSIGAGVVSSTASGLSEQTAYILYVRSNCGSSFSGWVASTNTTSPPSNDNCTGSISLTVNSTSTCTVTTTRGSSAATQSSVACAGTGADDDVWFSFVATNTSHFISVTPGTMSDVVFQVYGGSCSGLSSLSCVDLNAGSSIETTTVNSLTIGNTYYIRVHSYASTNGTRGTFTVCITTPCTTPTTAGTLTSNKVSTVVNDAVIFSIGGNGGSVSLLEWSFNNFTSVAGSVANPIMPYTVKLNVAQSSMYFRATSVSGSCPNGVTSPILVSLELAPPYTYDVSDGDYISNVTLGNTNNPSTNDGDGYQNFTSQIIELTKGEPYQLSVAVTNTIAPGQGVAAWIDYNADGVFQTSENIMLKTPANTHSQTFTIPLDATDTDVKMRVLSVWNNTPNIDAYYSTGYGYGEIEEYTVRMSVALPVELIQFETTPYPQWNVVKWTTASEYNSSHFDLEMSTDGEEWRKVATKNAAGNSTEEIKYSYIDYNLNSVTYYRLQQFDIDGQFKTYGPILVTKTITEKKIVKYINLMGQEINPEYATGVVIEIYDDGTMKKMIR